jgi:SAM-dependent methyltransferase
MTYVQYGCGHHAPPSWENFDSSPTILFERLPLVGGLCAKNAVRFPANVRRGNIVRGLPLPPASADAIYCSHTLEHLALDELRQALRNTFTLLKPGGVFRFVLPDLEFIARRYLTSSDSHAAHRFMEEAMLGLPFRPRSLYDFVKSWLGGSKHLWMWDQKAMEHELAAAGFGSIRRASFGDAADSMFSAVEQADRWTDCLGMECRRPASSDLP